jgi:DinB superfamily
MNAQLSAVIDQFERARDRMRRVSASTPDDRWAVRRDPARWSVAECIAHLNLTSRAYIPSLRAAFESHPVSMSPAHRYRRDAVGWLIGAFSGPMPRIGRFKFGRTKTRASFVPAGSLDRRQLVADFESLQDEQIALTREAVGRPLEAIRIVSPFEPRLSYNAYSCLWLLPRHQHRHLEQAAEVWPGVGDA